MCRLTYIRLYIYLFRLFYLHTYIYIYITLFIHTQPQADLRVAYRHSVPVTQMESTEPPTVMSGGTSSSPPPQAPPPPPVVTSSSSLSPHLGPATSQSDPSYRDESHGNALMVGAADDEAASTAAEEMDMFDIELQREFQLATAGSQSGPRTAAPSSRHATFPSAAVSLSPSGNGASMGSARQRPVDRVVSGYGAGRVGMLAVSPAGGGATPPYALSHAGKQLSSVAGACQLSVFTQDLDECVRLIHQMAEDIRHTAAAAADVVNGTCSANSPTAVSFEEDLALVTMVVQEINQAHNPAWRSPSSPSGAAVAAAASLLGGSGPLGSSITRASLAAISPTGAHGSGGRSNGGGTAHGTARTSPTTHLKAYNGGRSTIDTEVSDSLGRLNTYGTGHHSLHEYEQRPVNPFQGVPHGSYTTPRQAPQTQCPTMATAALSAGLPGSVAHSVGPTAPPLGTFFQKVPSHGGSVGAPMVTAQRRGTRSASGNVAHPRAVKPQPGTSKGRSRGPRSQTGKNVAPSNRSAFSECSGGETRSYHSTVTASQQNLSSSANVTTNTSLSSAAFRPHPSTASSVLNGANTGAAGATAANTVVLGAETLS